MGNKPSNDLKPEALNDLRKQTDFTEEELKQWYADFKKASSKDYLTKADFKKLYSQYFPSGDATKFTEHVYRTFDSNRDGSISFREFMCGMSVLARGTVDEKLSWIFSMYDINKDGYISRPEMLEILQSLYRMVGEMSDDTHYDEATPENKLEIIFRNVDRDGDNRLSLSEFLDAASNDPGIMSMLQ
ncbi:neurocalcin homolog [Lytechinus pictus]|uniref:neurocalcin homolog n=1 Tax=Lytechinus pictus TaxID=7653 RepID=UPI0030B9D0E1